MIRQVAKVNRRTVVVVETGAVGTTSGWSRRTKGIVQAWYPGQEQGHAIADVLWGDVNPSGKLPATLPRSERQVPTTPAGTAEFTESIFVGYRGFLENRMRPATRSASGCRTRTSGTATSTPACGVVAVRR
ncbi:glycoside hydrolase family 3 protein [Aeromicrobium sp. UC242_57]|uniref:glycoside hydrolase family 3 protein n=1 Tax=Aeromicrobium sp. UC242_57 TaxID=3374624 RepID=UPI0037BAD9DB